VIAFTSDTPATDATTAETTATRPQNSVVSFIHSFVYFDSLKHVGPLQTALQRKSQL